MTHSLDRSPEFDALRLMERDIGLALDTGIPVHERSIRVADRTVRFRFLGERIQQVMFPALAHLACAPVTDPDLEIVAWDSVSTGIWPSPLLRAIIETDGYDTLTPRMEVKLVTTERVKMSVVPWHQTTSMYDVDARAAVYWAPDVDSIPYHEHAAAFRTLLSWWLSGRDMYCVHAGAVGTPAGSVLLTGRGGSGKSTSALACVGSQLQYLADDYCAVSLGQQPRVHSLYNTAKLDGEVDLLRQPRFRPWVVNGDRLEDEKAMMFLHDHVPEVMLADAPLKAVVLPKVTARDTPTLMPVSRAAALRALAPTSLFQLPGTNQRALDSMAALVRAVPCYVMETGSDLNEIPLLLGELIDSLP